MQTEKLLSQTTRAAVLYIRRQTTWAFLQVMREGSFRVSCAGREESDECSLIIVIMLDLSAVQAELLKKAAVLSAGSFDEVMSRPDLEGGGVPARL